MPCVILKKPQVDAIDSAPNWLARRVLRIAQKAAIPKAKSVVASNSCHIVEHNGTTMIPTPPTTSLQCGHPSV